MRHIVAHTGAGQRKNLLDSELWRALLAGLIQPTARTLPAVTPQTMPLPSGVPQTLPGGAPRPFVDDSGGSVRPETDRLIEELFGPEGLAFQRAAREGRGIGHEYYKHLLPTEAPQTPEDDGLSDEERLRRALLHGGRSNGRL